MYEFMNKHIHRAAVLAMYDETKKPIVFLDDANAGASLYFIRAGVKAKHMKPVNFCNASAEQITKLAGVACVCDDIDNYLTTLDDDSCGVVWLDYTKRTVREQALRDSLRVAPFVSVTLSIRGVERDEFMTNLHSSYDRTYNASCRPPPRVPASTTMSSSRCLQ